MAQNASSEKFALRKFIFYTVHLIRINVFKFIYLEWAGNGMEDSRSAFKILRRKATSRNS